MSDYFENMISYQQDDEPSAVAQVVAVSAIVVVASLVWRAIVRRLVRR